MFGEASGLTGANLVKGNTPYSIFLPYVVRSLIDAYRFYSGPERLKRLGADLNEDRGERDNDNHGEWGLVPSSLGLVVVMVLRAKRKGFGGKEVEAFTEFKRLHPTSFIVDETAAVLFRHPYVAVSSAVLAPPRCPCSATLGTGPRVTVATPTACGASTEVTLRRFRSSRHCLSPAVRVSICPLVVRMVVRRSLPFASSCPSRRCACLARL